MTGRFEQVQAAYERWSEALMMNRVEIQRVTSGGTLDPVLLRTLSEIAKFESQAFTETITALNSDNKKTGE